jgi:hypothetical protein
MAARAVRSWAVPACALTLAGACHVARLDETGMQCGGVAGDCDPPLVCLEGACAEPASALDAATDTGEAGGDSADSGGSGDGSESGDATDAGGILFADSFDDGTPLPRAWDAVAGVAGAVGVQAVSDAPSAPNVLRTTSVADAAAPAYLKKTLATPGAQRVTCRFKVKLTQYGGFAWQTTAVLSNGDVGYVRLDLLDNQWQDYGQFGAQEIGDQPRVRPTENVWMEAELAISADGTVTATIDGDAVAATVSPAPVSSVSLELGVQGPPPSNTVETLYDDVVCTAR